MNEEDTFEDDDVEVADDEVTDEAASLEDVDSASLTAKETERLRIQAEIEAYLARGGKINEIPPNVVADPPKKPESNYGGQPI